MAMRKIAIVAILGLCICGPSFCEQDFIKSILSRTMVEVGGSLVEGDGWSADNLGYGMHFRTFTFFDARQPEGFYFGITSSTTLVHVAGQVSLGDLRLGTIGWRGSFGIPWIELDAAFSPVYGSRTLGTTVAGSGYIAASANLGVFFRVSDGFDIGLSFEPTLNLFSIKSDPAIANKSYYDICVFLCMKRLSLIQDMKWSKKASIE